MSNIVPFENMPVPAYLQNASEDELTKRLAGGSLNKRISIRGGTFRLVVDGKEVLKKEERFMNIVIVAAAEKQSRSYYKGKYVEGSTETPDCWSADSEKPDKTVEDPQSPACATCPQNVKGSGENDSRACRYSRRLAVVLDGEFEKDVYQLTLPATSIFGKAEGAKMPLGAYVQFLSAHGAPVGGMLTEMRFDVDATMPKVVFKPLRYLTQEEYEVCKQQGETPAALSAITMTVAHRDKANVPEAVMPAAPKAQEQSEGDEAPPSKKATVKDAPALKKSLQAELSKWANADDED